MVAGRRWKSLLGIGLVEGESVEFVERYSLQTAVTTRPLPLRPVDDVEPLDVRGACLQRQSTSRSSKNWKPAHQEASQRLHGLHERDAPDGHRGEHAQGVRSY